MTANNCATQELERFIKLRDRMNRSLETLRKALAGEVGMSNELEDLAKSIYNGTLPAMWRTSTPATLKSLGNWILFHIARFNQYNSWVNLKEPEVL
jgi:dynein heavy chain, axonemal